MSLKLWFSLCATLLKKEEGAMAFVLSKPQAPIKSSRDFKVFKWKFATRTLLSVISIPLYSDLSCVAMPTGHLPLSHCNACIQPSANIIPLALYNASAPRARFFAMSNAVITFPDAKILISSRNPCSRRVLVTHAREEFYWQKPAHRIEPFPYNL